jgi:uncharacterized membrane protein YkvA (DUF1232 family)
VPVLGYLDDALLLPLGVALVRRLIPADVREDCRARAQASGGVGAKWWAIVGAGAIIALWIGLIVAISVALRGRL